MDGGRTCAAQLGPSGTASSSACTAWTLAPCAHAVRQSSLQGRSMSSLRSSRSQSRACQGMRGL
eukprot:7587595-Alexandrium_andersonii.AAC.1